jgi:hypothetical protein
VSDENTLTKEEEKEIDKLVSFLTPEFIKKILDIDPFKLYKVLEDRYSNLTK